MAIEIERQGPAFYASCAAARATESVAEVFDYAAEPEQRHVETLARMKRELSEYTLPEDVVEAAHALIVLTLRHNQAALLVYMRTIAGVTPSRSATAPVLITGLS